MPAIISLRCIIHHLAWICLLPISALAQVNPKDTTVDFDTEVTLRFDTPPDSVVNVFYTRLHPRLTTGELIEHNYDLLNKKLRKRPFDIVLRDSLKGIYGGSRRFNIDTLRADLRNLKQLEQQVDVNTDSIKRMVKRIKGAAPAVVTHFDSLKTATDLLQRSADTIRKRVHFKIGSLYSLDRVPDFKPSEDKKSLLVSLKKREDIRRDSAIQMMTIYKPYGLFRKKVLRKWMPRTNNFLRPNSTYAFFVLYPAGVRLLPLFRTYHDTVESVLGRFSAGYRDTLINRQQIDSQTVFTFYDSLLYPASKGVMADLRELSETQVKESSGTASIDPTFSVFTDMYAKLRAGFKNIDSLKHRITSSDTLLQARVLSYRASPALHALQQFLQIEQAKDLAHTGPAADSLHNLYRIIGELNTVDSAGAIEMAQGKRVPGLSAMPAKDVAGNIERLGIQLGKLRMYVAHYVSDTTVAVSVRNQMLAMFATTGALIDAFIAKTRLLAEVADHQHSILKKLDDEKAYSGIVREDASTFISDVKTRGKSIVVPDFGLIGYGGLPAKGNSKFSGVAPYVGVQINFRAFNKSAQFNQIEDFRWYKWQRWSAHLGLTLVSLEEENKRKNLFAGGGLMTGLSYRLGGLVRLSGGALLFKGLDRSGLSKGTHLAATPYVGVSIDLDLQEIFSNIFGSFIKK